jgi:hypothetical protein
VEVLALTDRNSLWLTEADWLALREDDSLVEAETL